MSVERLRTLVAAGGRPVRKSEIIETLQTLSRQGVVEIDVSRRWRLRGMLRGGAGGNGSAPIPAIDDDALHALPARVVPGDPRSGDALPLGQELEVDLNLLWRLLPYYQDALKASDSANPIETLARCGERFLLLRPDQPWWPTQSAGRALRVSRQILPPAFLEALARHQGRKLLIGYPLLLVSPRQTDGDPFLRPVGTYACSFELGESDLRVDLPASPPSLNPAWLKDQVSYSRWTSATELRSWLLYEDDAADVRDDDDDSFPEFVEVPQFASRLEAALKQSVRSVLEPAAIDWTLPRKPLNGFYNGVLLAIESGNRYTRSAVRDYDRLIAMDASALGETAAASLVGLQQTSHKGPSIPVVHPFEMSETQLMAARASLTGPLTVVTGPPGTGKSQVIASLMLSAAAAGKSVLFAARQHRALDAVQERLEQSAGDRVVLIRANESEGPGGFNFSQAVTALLARAGDAAAHRNFEQLYREISDIDEQRWNVLSVWRKLLGASGHAAALRDSLETTRRNLARSRAEAQAKGLETAQSTQGPLRQLVALLLRLLGIKPTAAIGTMWAVRQLERQEAEQSAALNSAEEEINRLRLEAENLSTNPVELTRRITVETERLVPRLLDRLDDVSVADRQALTTIVGDSALGAGSDPNTLSEHANQLILQHFPLWAVTTLAAGSRLPMRAGLFDYVVFDEASQIDIASALPLMVRAKNAVVVGDPQQLGMISNLDPRADRELLSRHGLFRPGIGRFAQGQTTLFALAASCAHSDQYLLVDHFRCHPDIAGYISEAFYGRRLAALTDVQRLHVPSGMKAGLHWTHVAGPISRRVTGTGGGSAGSFDEADVIAREVKRLADSDYAGTIGVVAFYNYQAEIVQRRLRELVPTDVQDRHAIKVFTANKFQGDERDVILFSLCVGPDMPPGARNFAMREKRLVNVAVSRARAICHIVGNLDFADSCGIPHFEALARRYRQSQQRYEPRGDDRFDSPWEKRLYQELVERGLEPIPQHPVAGRFLDLALMSDAPNKVRLDVEVDGWTYHTDDWGGRLPTDQWRDHQLQSLGWKVRRFWVHELRDDMGGCVDRIIADCQA